jgi:hypothetical protein
MKSGSVNPQSQQKKFPLTGPGQITCPIIFRYSAYIFKKIVCHFDKDHVILNGFYNIPR